MKYDNTALSDSENYRYAPPFYLLGGGGFDNPHGVVRTPEYS